MCSCARIPFVSVPFKLPQSIMFTSARCGCLTTAGANDRQNDWVSVCCFSSCKLFSSVLEICLSGFVQHRVTIQNPSEWSSMPLVSFRKSVRFYCLHPVCPVIHTMPGPVHLHILVRTKLRYNMMCSFGRQLVISRRARVAMELCLECIARLCACHIAMPFF